MWGDDVMRAVFNYVTDLKQALSFHPEQPVETPHFAKRQGNDVEFLVDGEEAMWSIASALQDARETVDICDWKMDPEIVLVRRDGPLQGLRIRDLLAAAAARGVAVRVLLYRSPPLFELTHNKRTARMLRRLHPNIACLCKRWSLVFSHHEKLIVVDGRVAFIGGLDLARGRFDTNEHPLDALRTTADGFPLFPSTDFNNAQVDGARRWKTPRMPWHDVECRLAGPVVADLATHFDERWGFYGGARRDVAPQPPVGSVDARVFRSVCRSSGSALERSVYQEMIRLIRRAKRFIYIEQQYFLSNAGRRAVWNHVGAEIAARIARAAAAREPFFVIVVLPVFSEGQLTNESVR